MVRREAVLDEAHVGDIQGALGTIARHDVAPRRGWTRHLRTFLAILGPGLIVMVGDNDAGAFGTYAQAGQNYGTTLLWTLLLLVPVLYVNQEMVLRLGVVSGVGHARLILERFGKFWGAFSVVDLFVLNALTIVTEFIGIALAADYLGVPRLAAIAAGAVVVIGIAGTGSFRRFERFSIALCAISLLLVPVFVLVHPPVGQMLHDLVVPGVPPGAPVATVMLLVIGIVGTTVAPWQLFFQQSYVIDKRITPRYLNYERADLALGIVFVTIGAIAIMALAAATFHGRPEFGNFADAGAVAAGIGHYAGRLPGVLFALALIDASVIGAAAVSLSTAYAIGDVLTFKHSLHRKVSDAPGFYAIYVGLIVIAAALVVIPGVPLGLLTNAVQALAGVLLPSATIFLLLLSNDRAVLGPWTNTHAANVFTSVVVTMLVMLSLILTASVLFPQMGSAHIVAILAIGGTIAFVTAVTMSFVGPRRRAQRFLDRRRRATWSMPPLSQLPSMRLGNLNRAWLIGLRLYLVLAVGLVVFRVTQIALHTG